MVNVTEPKLEREGGYIGLRQFPKFAKGRGDREIKFSKLLFLIKLDKGQHPSSPPTPDDSLLYIMLILARQSVEVIDA